MQRVIQSVLIAAILIGTPKTAGAESVMSNAESNGRRRKRQERPTARRGHSS
jgi:hypothetical protein